MKRYKKYFARYLAPILLVLFAVAITPWNTFHDHGHATTETNCTHKIHIKKQSDHCYVCKAVFEKNFIYPHQQFKVYLSAKILTTTEPILSISFTELISTALRGPPFFIQ